MLTNSSVVPQKPPVGFYHIITTLQKAGAYMIEIPLKSTRKVVFSESYGRWGEKLNTPFTWHLPCQGHAKKRRNQNSRISTAIAQKCYSSGYGPGFKSQ